MLVSKQESADCQPLGLGSNLPRYYIEAVRRDIEIISELKKNEDRQGRSQKWPKEGVLRREIAKGGGFEGAEALRIRTR